MWLQGFLSQAEDDKAHSDTLQDPKSTFPLPYSLTPYDLPSLQAVNGITISNCILK